MIKRIVSFIIFTTVFINLNAQTTGTLVGLSGGGSLLVYNDEGLDKTIINNGIGGLERQYAKPLRINDSIALISIEGNVHSHNIKSRITRRLSNRKDLFPGHSALIKLGGFYYTTMGPQLVRFNPATNILSNVYNIPGWSYSNLIAINNTIYGVSEVNGKNNDGFLYSYTPDSNHFQILYHFNESTTGKEPLKVVFDDVTSSLIVNLKHGGLYGNGTIGRYNIATKSFNILHHFQQQNTIHYKSLSISPNRKLYGFVWNTDQLFSLSLEDSLVEYITLPSTEKVYAGLTFINDNEAIFGTFTTGKYFKINLTTNEIEKFYENDINTGIIRDIGELINDSIVLFTNLLSYPIETTSYTTINIKKIDSSSTHNSYDSEASSSGKPVYVANQNAIYWSSSKYIFKYDGALKKYAISNNEYLNANLTYDNKSHLYGTSENGKLYKFNVLSKSYDVLFEITNDSLGKNPNGNLLLVGDTLIYGTCKTGGEFNKGTLFKYYTTNNQFTKLLDFDGVNGVNPQNGPVYFNDSTIIGVTGNASTNTKEYILNPKTNRIVINTYNYITGRIPTGQITKTDSITYYGLHATGGNFNQGSLFKKRLNNSSTNIGFYFWDSAGCKPSGSLTKTKNNLLFGYTTGCLEGNKGALFQFDTDSLKITIKSLNEGAFMPVNDGGVCFIDKKRIIIDTTINVTACNHYVSPSGNFIWETTGVYQDQISSLFNTINYTINLTINQVQTNIQQVDTCGYYQWIDGNVYRESGSYYYHSIGVNGCDIINQLNLTIESLPPVEIDDSFPGKLIANQGFENYQWFNCDTETVIENEIKREFSPTSNGNYKVIVTTNYGCTTSSDCVLYNTVGINKMDREEFSIYPNPCGDNINIVFESYSEDATIEIYNSIGKLVDRLNMSSKQQQFNIASYKPGLYSIKTSSHCQYFIKD